MVKFKKWGDNQEHILLVLTVGHAIVREADATFTRTVQVSDIVHDAADLDLDVFNLWDGNKHQPQMPELFPLHHTDEMFHLIIRLADICPGHSLQKSSCLPLPREI